MYDNWKLNFMCQHLLKMKSSTNQDANSLISQFLINSTSTMRYPSLLMNDNRKLAVSLVPFPRMHFMVPSLANIYPKYLERWDNTADKRSLIGRLWDHKNILLDIDPSRGRTLTFSSIFRGPNLSPVDIDLQLDGYLNSNTSYFVEWIPDHRQLAFIAQPGPTYLEEQASMMNNTFAIRDPLKRIGEEFTAMFRRKAFLHYYTQEGMDEMEFVEAESNVNDLLSEYEPHWGCCGCGAEDDEEEAEDNDEL